jgi:hypothetical protein
MGNPIFYKAERFFPTEKYETFSKIFGRKEIVTYDCMLCKVVLDDDSPCDTGYAGESFEWESFMRKPFEPDEQIIAYFKNPSASHETHAIDGGFEFCGYDLSEELTQISAITNCGGWDRLPELNDMLNPFGLIERHEQALQMQISLREAYPEESHADCEIYELWRKIN